MIPCSSSVIRQSYSFLINTYAPCIIRSPSLVFGAGTINAQRNDAHLRIAKAPVTFTCPCDPIQDFNEEWTHFH